MATSNVDMSNLRPWDDAAVAAMQAKVVGRGHVLIGVFYDFEAYAAFALEVLSLRNENEMEAGSAGTATGSARLSLPMRWCSAGCR